MPEYILRLIAEAKNHSDALDMKVNGNVPGVGDVFTLDKEYPPCVVTYQVTSVSPMNIKVVNAANSMGFIILILLMLLVTYHDIIKLF